MPTTQKSLMPPPGKIELPAQRVLDSAQLLGGASMVAIAHAGQQYVLRVTRENKLILTK